MTILVTGGTGLVGSRLLRRFVDASVDCRALVRLRYGGDGSLRNLAQFMAVPARSTAGEPDRIAR